MKRSLKVQDKTKDGREGKKGTYKQDLKLLSIEKTKETRRTLTKLQEKKKQKRRGA